MTFPVTLVSYRPDGKGLTWAVVNCGREDVLWDGPLVSLVIIWSDLLTSKKSNFEIPGVSIIGRCNIRKG